MGSDEWTALHCTGIRSPVLTSRLVENQIGAAAHVVGLTVDSLDLAGFHPVAMEVQGWQCSFNPRSTPCLITPFRSLSIND